KIMYGVNFSENIQSNISSTTVANAVLKVSSLKIFLNQIKCYHNIKFYYFQKLFPLNENSLISGVHIFGIHLITLKKARESVKENHIQLIPREHCSRSTINKRQHKFGNKLKQCAQVEGAKIY